MLLAVCECCDLLKKILVDLERQGTFLIVWWEDKKAASSALLMKMWGRPLVRTCSWTPVGGWSRVDTGGAAHAETPELVPCGGSTGLAGRGSQGSVPPSQGKVGPEVMWWLPQGTGPQPTQTRCSGPSVLWGAVTLACEFPCWALAFRSSTDSLATVLSRTHPVWVYFSALWDAVASTAENAVNGVCYLNAFASLGEA